MELLDDRSRNPFADHTLILTDPEGEHQKMDTATYLMQNEMVEIPSRNCALFPLTGGNKHIVGLFLISVPQSPGPSITREEMDIIRDTKTMIISGLEQYLSVVSVSQAANRQKQMTKTMLQEGKGAVKSVRTYAKMLSFRPNGGSLERDMIDGIEHQGERMPNIVRRLETSLNADQDHMSIFAPSDLPSTAYLDN